MLARDKTELRFKEVVHWDVDALCTDFATWMTADTTQPVATSRVGVLSSMQCQKLLFGYLNDDLCKYLPLLVRTSSLLYNRQDSPHPCYTYEQLSSARSLLGNELLINLETALKPIALSKKSKQQLEALFLIVFGTIIAVVYTCNTDSEGTRIKLIQILTHYLVLIGERVGLLQCDMKKLQLIQECHNLWNKTGSFGWDHSSQSAPNDLALSALGGSSPAFMENYSNPGSSKGAYNSTSQHDHHCVSDRFLSHSTSDSVLPQTRLSYDAAIPSSGNLLPAQDWAGSTGADRSSSSRAIEMTTCLICNQYHPISDLCPYCFGQPLSVAASSEAISQNGLDREQQSLQSQTPCPDFTNTEDFPTYGNGIKAWSSDSFGGSGLPISESNPISSQTLRESFRAGTSIVSDGLLTINDNSKLSTTVKATKRKRTTDNTMVPEHESCKIQDTVKEHEARLSRDSEENHKQALNSKWKYPCWHCGHKICYYCKDLRNQHPSLNIWSCCQCFEYQIHHLV